MAIASRHDRLLLRLLVALTLAACLFGARTLRAQQAKPDVLRLPDAQQPAPPPHEHVLDIRIEGNRTITREKVLANIGTKINQPFDQSTFDRDVRKLVGKGWFVHVEPHRERTAGGMVITLRVVERPTLEYVRYLGWKKIKPRTLAKQTELKKGDPLDPFAVEEGARKIETYYQTKGYNDVKVEVLEGKKPSDRGAIYLIHEGKSQKVWSVRFEGNNVASDGRLKTQIQSKPPLLYLFKGHVDRRKIEEDVDRLTDYYRSLGYFRAQIGRDYEWNDEEDWMTLVFFINEGPRYQVREISFLGNQVYDNEALGQGLKLKPGDYFDRAKMNADIGYIKDVYGANGYVFADAQPDLQFEIEPGPLDIMYKITEGSQCLVGDINVHIQGESTHTRRTTAINALPFRPGDVIDIRKIRKAENTIKRMGVFNTEPAKGEVPRIVLSPPATPELGEDGEAVAEGGSRGARGQSPDPPRSPVVRYQSPGSYGGSAVNPISPGGTAYPSTTQQPVTGYTTQTPNPYLRPSAAPQPQAPYGVTAQPNPYLTPAAAPYAQPTTGAIGPAAAAYAVQQPGNYVAQAPAYSTQPPAGYSSQPPIVGAPPAGTIYQPASQPGGYPPGYGAGPIDQPGNNSFLPGPEPEPILPDNRPRIPVDIYLNEAQTGRFMFGAGVNSNAGLVGSIILDEQNFDWRRFPTSWEDFRAGRAFRGDGQKFRIEAAPGTQVSRYMFNFAEPYLLDTPVSLGLSGYYFQRFYQDWTEARTGGRTSLGYQFSPDLSGSLAFRGENVNISNPIPSDTTNVLMTNVLGNTTLLGFTGTVAWDTRDSTFLPTQGAYIALAVGYTEGSFQYATYTVDFRKFFLMRQRPDGSGRHVLSFYNQFGITGDDTPIYERFYAGGFSTLRGFQFRGASPVELAGSATNPDATIQVGGNFQNLSSLEYMFPLTADDMLRAVVFCDFGTVEQDVRIDWNNFRVAPGMGLRISLPAMGPAPIAIDFAVPVAYADTDERQLVQFFVGYSR